MPQSESDTHYHSLNNNGKKTEYYYVGRINNGDWTPILKPFLVQRIPRSGIYGSFISSNWFKTYIPKEYECAIIEIFIDIDIDGSRKNNVGLKLVKCAGEMNKCENVSELDFVIMKHKMSQKYLVSMCELLNKKLKKEGDCTATIHEIILTDTGKFGCSFALRQDDQPCLYCPNFSVY